MEVTALCIRLLIIIWMLLLTQVQDSCYAQKASLPHLVPARLQYFEYESISFNCEGLHGSLGLGVMRRLPSESATCGKNWGFSNGSHCIIRSVYVEDSGEYWCETGDGKKSDTVNVTVTAGSVILETPVIVMEGEAVTLHCKNKTASNISASFYKNDLFIKNISTGNLIIQSVSKCDEGLYKCRISGAGESPESWLSVKEYHKETIPLCSDQLPVLLYLLIRTVVTVLWVALLLLVLRKRHYEK
ncbi:putative high affinity immunoglobulin gamma Fc receptor IB isoform X2 [Dicentrarchus labrax]|uniref:putative high affinity immunoglobulin gamma Fc receptor IB isoform X2 n=1 Tax=Dicentrarchus labrax TaxID=13489 RepID=UPI0021F51B23|nr:putative high affinity immunoglobulin gamma Fc receptor IB isoform X2 [Dicentrarchus labrax]